MKRDYLKVLAVAAFASFIGGALEMPVYAGCHQAMTGQMHQSCSSFVQSLSTTGIGSASPVGASYTGATVEEQLALLEPRISKLDNELTESLGKITRLQELQFNDQANSQEYAHEIECERKNLTRAEDELTGLLKQQEEFKAQIKQGIEQEPINNASSNAQFHESLN